MYRTKEGYRGLSGYISAIVSGILLGTYFMIVKQASDSTNALAMTFWMATIASGLSSLILCRRSDFTYLLNILNIFKNRQDTKLLLLLSLVGYPVAAVTFFIGMSMTEVSQVIVLTASEMVFTVLLATAFFGNSIKGQRIGIIVIMAGVFIATLSYSDISFRVDLGMLLVIIASFFYAIYNNLCREASKIIDSDMQLVRLNSVFGAVMMIPVLFIFQTPIQINAIDIPYLLYMGAIGAVVPTFLYFYSARRIGTVRTIIAQEIVTPINILLAIIILHENVNIWILFTCSFIIIIGVYLLYKQPNLLKNGRR